MVGIVSGSNFGLDLTSLRILGAQGEIGNAQHGSSREAVYVNVATGNLVVQDIDDLLVGRGPDLPSLRTYNSRGVPNDDNGDGWTNGIALRPLVLTGTFNASGSSFAKTERDGTVFTYRWSGPNTYTCSEGLGAARTLTFVAADNQLEWRDGGTGLTQRFEASGGYKLLSMRDPSGNALTYAYNAQGNLASVTTANGEVSYYDYAGPNLTQIRTVTADGTTSTAVRYAYDASNRLTQVIVDLSPGDNSVADGKVYQTNYTYDAVSGRLASLVQSDGTSLFFTYSGSAGNYRVTSVRDALGATTTFSYSSSGPPVTTVTDPAGVATRYDIDIATGYLSRITTGNIRTASFTYTSGGDLRTMTDGAGRVTTYAYDAQGNQTLKTDGAGSTTRTYDVRNQLLTETVSGSGLSATTRFVYDSGGRNLLRFAISPEGRVTEHRYDAFGQRVATIVYTASTYPVAGLSSTASPSEAAVSGWATSQNPQATQRTDMVYDARGQLQTRTRYAALDANGAGVLDGSQSVERFVYDQAGRLLQAIAPSGGPTSFVYDGLGRQVASTDASGQVTLTQFLDSARKTVLTLANGLVRTSVHDAAGRLVSSVDATATGQTLGETKYFYDVAGRLRMTQDPTGVRHWLLYDTLGRQVAEIDGNGTLTESAYDGSGLLTLRTIYATAVDVASLVDAAGQPVLGVTLAALRPAASVADAVEWRSYDAARRLFRIAHAIGASTVAVTEHRYDAASRLVEVVRYANLLALDDATVTAGQIAAPAASNQDRSTRSFYDGDGRLLATLDAEGYLVRFSYAASGQLVERVAYATATDPLLRATGLLAQLQPPASTADARTVYLRDVQGRLIGEIDAEGYLTESVYDANGNLTTSVRYANRATGAILPGSSIAAVRPAPTAADQVTLRAYDRLDRLVQETSPEGVVTQYGYDAGGRLVSTIRAAGTGESRSLLARYDLQGRLVGELSAQGAALLSGGQTQAEVDAIWAQYGTSHAYDAAGRRIASTDAAGNRTWFFYDADGALTHTVNALGEVQEMRYDGLGRLTDRIRYAARIATTGLVGGLVPGSLTAAVAAIANPAADSRASISYTRDAQVAASVDAEGFATTFSYNAFGEQIGSVQALGGGAALTQTFAVDRRGLRIGVVADPAGVNALTSTVFDAFGRAVRSIDANGNVREQVFDRLGRQVVSLDPLGAATATCYDAFDRVLTQTDALGRTTRYAYDASARTMTVTTPEGIVTATTFNRHGQVQSIADGKGQLTSYSYDRNGRLVQTSTPLTTAASSYDRAGRLVQTIDANGNKVSYAYDAAGRVLTRTVDPGGLNLVTTYQYDGKGQQVAVTDPNGVVTTTAFDRKGQVVRQTVDPTGLNLQTVWSYDGAGRALTTTSPAGTVTQTVYDALGRRVQERVDPGGLKLTRSWTYDKNGNAVASTDALGNTTRFVYDAADRLVFTVDPLGNLRQNAYDAAGRITKVAAYATPIATAGLPVVATAAMIQGLVISQPALDQVEHRLYDGDGRLTWTVDGTGAVVRQDHDANGNVVRRTAYARRIDMASWQPGTAPAPAADNAHDARTSIVYDALDRAIYTVDSIGAVVASRYDGNGNLLQRTAYATAIAVTTAPTQAAIASALVSDAARDATVRNTYDAANRLTWSVDGVGAVTQTIYDKAGNVVRQVAYANAIAAGALPSSVVASSADRATSMAYDAANRLVFQIDAQHGVVELAYDPAGHIVRRTAYANAISAVPALGTLGTAAAIRAALVPSGATDRTTRFAFDTAGRRVLVIDPQGAAVRIDYDAAGHAVAETAYAALLDTSLIGAQPSLASLLTLVRRDDANDRTTQRAYDSSGCLVYEVDPGGAVKAWQYDGIGRLVRTTRYANLLPAGTDASLAAISAALRPAADADQVELSSYNAAGQLVASTDALGSTESFTYDALGRKLSFTNRLGATWIYDSDAAGRLVRETSPDVDLATISVNGAGALVLQTGASGSVVTRMAYDALGRLTQRTEAEGRPEQRTTRYEYDALGRQVRVVFQAVGVYDAASDAPTTNGATGVAARTEAVRALETRTFYDALGNAVAGVDVGGALSQKAYDLNGNLVYEIDALGYVTGFQRNAFGEVTSLVRYGSATALANGTVTQASHAATRFQVDAALAAPGFSHAADRVLAMSYDRAGRVVQVVEPDAYVYDPSAQAGQKTDSVGKTTRTSYNAFGQATQVQVLRNARTGNWSTTTRIYDKAGREIATVDALGYLTTRGFDAMGNLSEVREWATALAPGAWTATKFNTPGVSQDDRMVKYAYDRLNRMTAETRVGVEYSQRSDGSSTRGNAVTTFGYDAVGNQVRMTDALGNTTYTYFDKLGRVERIAAPARPGPDGTTSLTPLTEFRRDAYGNVLARIEYANGAASANATAAVAGAASTADRTTLSRYDVLGRAVQTTDANGSSQFSSYDAWGHLAKSWQGVTGNDGITRTLFQLDVYDKLGRLVESRTPASTSVLTADGRSITTLTQAQAGTVVTALEYNAFGEMTRRGTQGDRQEYFDYDSAGRLWRTNSGDGIDRIHLFDAQGNVTAEIRSAGLGRDNVDIRGFVNAQAADASTSTRRLDITRDALGRVTRQEEAARLELQGGVAVQRAFVTASGIGSALPGGGGPGILGNESAWSGQNRVTLGWNSLTGLGAGDLKVTIEYQTPVVVSSPTENEGSGLLPVPRTVTGGTARSYTSGVFDGDEAANGVTLAWTETSSNADGGVGRINRIIVWKRDLSGAWNVVLDQAPGYGRNAIEVAAPPDPRTVVSLEMRVAGTAGDGGWWAAGLVNFGSVWRFDAGGLPAGSYEYRVKITPPAEAARTIGTGTVSITLPPLNTISTPIAYQGTSGVLAWQTPGPATEQVLRYRASGSSGAWSTLAVLPTPVNQFDGVDTSGLAPGSYQFELLWTPAGTGAPSAHAVGQFTVTAPQSSYTVPPVNLPPITGLAIGTTVVGGTISGYGEYREPIYTGGTTVPALQWNAALADSLRYRPVGGAWASLAIDNSGQWQGEYTVSGVQKAALNGLAPGTYELQLTAGSPPERQATATLTIYPQAPGSWTTVTVQVATSQPIIAYYAPVYETRYGTRQVAYQVWVNDPPVIVGYTEYGAPIYSYPGHYETRYTTETYAYQVQVGQTPVYAKDEYGNVLYQTVYVPQQQQVWVPGATPAPTIAITTPPHTPGYTVAATPASYSVSLGTAAGSTVISSVDGATVAQAAAVNGGDRWQRPVIQQTLDRWGNVLEVNDPRSLDWKTRYRYNANNQLVQQIRPDAAGRLSDASPVTQIYYDLLGRQVAVRDANGYLNGQEFDAAGNLVRELHADQGIVRHRYDAFDQKVATTDAEGGIVRFTYDRLGRLIATDHGEAVVWRANGANALEMVGRRAIVDSWTYDQLGRKLTQTNGNGETLLYVYDLRGNVVETRQPLGQAVRAAFDAQGHKLAEVDANGAIATWTYKDGLLRAHTDLGGIGYTYSYDHARQLVSQTSNGGQSLTFGYDAAGQQTSIMDWATGKVSTFAYDLAGRRIREKVVQGGQTYQDNHLSYDAQGNLRDVADGRVHIVMEYDKVGNRTRVTSTVGYQGVAGEVASTTDRYFRYDGMNRQIVVDAVDAAGEIGRQGHKIVYDLNGNRISDTSWGNRVVSSGGTPLAYGFDQDTGQALYAEAPVSFSRSEGLSTETYRYDALNRLQSVVRDGVQIDLRYYDGAGRVVQSGPAGNLLQGYADALNEGLAPGEVNGKETRINRYDANGRLLHQKVLTANGDAKMDISWDPTEVAQQGSSTFSARGYDAAGNVLGYVVQTWQDSRYINEYVTTLRRGEGYQAASTRGASTLLQPGTTTQQYDANGFLVGIIDSGQAANSRSFVNDAAGRALWVKQAGNVQRQLIVNGEVLGAYGVGVDAAKPGSGGNPNFTNLADFNFGYAHISASYPNASPGAYQVRTGDTLQSIAQAAYGDSKLWYRIAEANGLSSSNALKVGQTLTIPAGVGTISNDGTTFKPYDPTRLQGDTAPTLAMPAQGGGGCGGVGKLLMIVVAVVVTIYTAGAVSGFTGSFVETMTAGMSVLSGTGATATAVASSTLGTMGTLAVSAAAGAAAGQVVGLATGAIDRFDWRGVALSAVSAAVTGGLLKGGGSAGAAMVRYAVGNTITQGIGVVMGLQKQFDWRGVAASAVGAGVNATVGTALNGALGGSPVGSLLAASMTGLASGAAAAMMRGGRVSIQQVATDAFGNAIGSSLAEAAISPGTTAMGAGPANNSPRFGELGSGTYGVGDGLTFGARQNTGPATAGAMVDEPYVGGLDDRNGMDVASDTYNGSRRVVTIGRGQGPLAAMAGMGFSEQQQRAMYGQLVRSGQLSLDAKGMPVVQLGRQLYLDLDDMGGAALGGRLIAAESGNRATIAAAEQRAYSDSQLVGAGSGSPSQVVQSRALESVDAFSLVNQDYYVAPGPVSRYYQGQVAQFSDSSQPWYVRSLSFANATLASPLMLLEEGGRGVMNVPYAGSQVGQNAAIFNQAADADTRVFAGLNVVKFGSEGFVNAYAGGVLGRQVYVQVQDEAVSYWLKKQFDGDIRKFNEVYTSAVDGTRRLGYTFNGVSGYRVHNTEVMATKAGEFMSLERPVSPADAIERNALSPLWGNNATELYQVTTRSGFYFKGQVAPQNGWYQGSPFSLGGGNTQVFMPATPNPFGGYPVAPWASGLSKKVPYGG